MHFSTMSAEKIYIKP